MTHAHVIHLPDAPRQAKEKYLQIATENLQVTKSVTLSAQARSYDLTVSAGEIVALRLGYPGRGVADVNWTQWDKVGGDTNGGAYRWIKKVIAPSGALQPEATPQPEATTEDPAVSAREARRAERAARVAKKEAEEAAKKEAEEAAKKEAEEAEAAKAAEVTPEEEQWEDEGGAPAET